MDQSRYFHLYQTKAAHDADYARSSANYIEPWVGYVTATEEVSYNLPPCGEPCEYLTFTALESGTFSLTLQAKVTVEAVSSVSYSIDDGETWTTTNNVTGSEVVITTPTISQGESVLWKANAVQFTVNSDDYPGGNFGKSYFSSTGNFNISGNMLSMLYGDDFQGKTSFKTLISNGYTAGTFGNLFYGATHLVDASHLVLSPNVLTNNCYANMFYGCTSLTTAPELPATTLATACYNGMFNSCSALTNAPEIQATTLVSSCYYYMFHGCTSLTTAPALPATTLAQSCYGSMFGGCTGLTTAPSLQATTLSRDCYNSMFYGCTSLTTAPELPATTLVTGCYSQMFNNCTRLNYIKAMFTTTPSTSYTASWLNNVKSTGTFVKNSAAEWDVTGANGIPSGWTVQTASE